MIYIRFKYYLLSLFLITISTGTYAQWEQIFEKEDGTWSFKDVHFFDQDTGIVIAETNSLHQNPISGYIISTEDGGQTWDTSSLYLDTTFLKMEFVNRYVGYIVARTSPLNELYLYKTIDGGNNWMLHSYIMPGSILECSLNFFDENIGIISAYGGTFNTYDGGFNWTQSISFGNVNTSLLGNVLFMTDGNGYLCSYDTLNTYDVYSVFNSGSITSHTIDVVNNDTLLTVTALGNNGGDYGYPYFNFGMIRIVNHGSGEFNEVMHFPYQRPRTLARTESGFIYAGTFDTEGYDKRFLKSIDGGQTWFSQQVNESQLPPTTTIKNMHCVNDTVCFATSGPVIYKTTNGGGALIEQVGFAYSSVEENASLENTLLIYPNPAEDILNITTDEKIEHVQVVNLSGKVLLTVADGNASVDVGHLKSGVYLVKIQTDKNSCIRKFVKQ